jgi:hypothetical protein
MRSPLHADERSPLCGHTYDSLAAMNAEIVVTFEATTEVRCSCISHQPCEHGTFWETGSVQLACTLRPAQPFLCLKHTRFYMGCRQL